MEQDEPVFEDDDSGSDLPPFIPFPPHDDGDPIEVYPSQNGGSFGGRDDTMKVVAVATAAVIVAILAIVLASTYARTERNEVSGPLLTAPLGGGLYSLPRMVIRRTAHQTHIFLC